MKKFAETWWTIEDVQDRYADILGNKDCPWSDEQCEVFLTQHQDSIVMAMCSAGWDVITNHLWNELAEED